jgi:hypothetical protein
VIESAEINGLLEAPAAAQIHRYARLAGFHGRGDGRRFSEEHGPTQHI